MLISSAKSPEICFCHLSEKWETGESSCQLQLPVPAVSFFGNDFVMH